MAKKLDLDGGEYRLHTCTGITVADSICWNTPTTIIICLDNCVGSRVSELVLRDYRRT